MARNTSCPAMAKVCEKSHNRLSLIAPSQPEMLMRATNFPNSIEMPLSPLSKVARNGRLAPPLSLPPPPLCLLPLCWRWNLEGFFSNCRAFRESGCYGYLIGILFGRFLFTLHLKHNHKTHFGQQAIYSAANPIVHKLSIQGLCKNHTGPESRVCARWDSPPCN